MPNDIERRDNMKKLFVILMLVIVMALSTIYVSAKEVAVLPAFDVYFNGNKVESDFREYPLLVYKDITYFPMTYFDSRHLGLVTEWDDATRTLNITNESISAALRDYKRQEKNQKTQQVKICDFNITLWGNPIDNSKEEYPLITFRDVTYFPLTWRFAYELFCWSYEFTPEKGLSIEAGAKSRNVRLPYLDGVFACDENYYYYVGYKDGKQSIYRADIDDTESYTIIYDFPDNGSFGVDGKCLVWIFSDMGNIYFKYHAGSNLMGTTSYVKINPDGTAIEEAPKNYTHSVRAVNTYYKETADMSLVVKHDYYDAPSKFYYTIDGVEHEAQMHPDTPHVTAYQDGKTASNSVSSDSLIQILGKSIYFVGKNPGVSTDSSLYRIDTETGKTEKLLENVGAFQVYYGLGMEFYNGWDWKYVTEEDMSYNVIFDRNGVLYCYNIDKGVETEISGTSKGKLITGFDNNIVAQQNLETKEDIITIFGVPYSGNVYNKKYLSTKNGAKMYLCGDSLIYQITSELPDDEIRLAVIRKGFQGGFRSSDVANHVYVNDNTILYSLFGSNETIVRINFQ